MEKNKLLVLLSNIPLVEALTLEQIANRIKTAKIENPELIPEVRDVYAKDNNLVFDINGMLFEVDGPAILEMSRRRIPEA
jgi:hypothetical protein